MQAKIFLLAIQFLIATTLMSQTIENSELFLPNSNVTLNFQQAGSGGNTIVLIHGLGSNSKAFKKNMPALAKKAKVIALDLPGYGKTDLGDFVPGMANYANAITEFIELKKLGNVTLVGHSMGGQIALQLAAGQQPLTDQQPTADSRPTVDQPPTADRQPTHDQRPSWLKNLVLLAPAGLEQFTGDEKKWFHSVVNDQLYLNMTDEQIKQNFNMNFFGGQLPEDAQFMVSDRLELKEDVENYKIYVSIIVKGIYAMLAEPVYDKIADIQVPIQVIYGNNDMLIPNKILHPQLTLEMIMEKLKSDYPKIKMERLDEAGHFVLWDQSDAVNDRILEGIRN